MEGVIVKKARELFFMYGLKSVSMDDLAKEASVSKKTIYQLVADKSELVEKVVNEWAYCHTETLLHCRQQSQNAVQEVGLMAQLPFATIASVSVNFFYELEKYFQPAWERLMEHKQKVIVPAITQNLQRGMAEDYYRQDLDVALLADIRIQQLTNALKPNGFTSRKTDSQKLMNSLTQFYLHGITSTKGKKIIYNYLNGNDEN
jgi:AcrR family transcriptional regulator